MQIGFPHPLSLYKKEEEEENNKTLQKEKEKVGIRRKK